MSYSKHMPGRRGRGRMIVGFTLHIQSVPITTYCKFESRSGRDVQHYVIMFVSDL